MRQHAGQQRAPALSGNGNPLGIWHGRAENAQNAARPPDSVFGSRVSADAGANYAVVVRDYRVRQLWTTVESKN